MKPLVVEGLTAQKENHVLLERVRLEVSPGSVTGIIADNPERLNLLIDILGGIDAESSGRLLFSGKPWTLRQRRHGVGVARERVSLVDNLSVVDNLYLSNPRLHSVWGVILRQKRKHHAREVLDRLQAATPLNQPLRRVDPGQRALLDVARVLIQDPPYLIFQRVTRDMSLRQYEAFRSVVEDLRVRGRGVILVPVNAEDVHQFVDRLYLLQGTQLFEVDGAGDLTVEQLNGYFLGTERRRLNTAPDPIFRAKILMQERCEQPDLDFAALALEVGMSYDNFRRRFKQHLGVSPHQFFLATKTDKAKELLRFTDLEIKDVARTLGFADPYYFSRFFKERMGSSPLQFRNGTRKEE